MWECSPMSSSRALPCSVIHLPAKRGYMCLWDYYVQYSLFLSLSLRKGKANKCIAALLSYLGFWQLNQTKTYQISHHFSSMRKVSCSHIKPTVPKHPLATSGVCKTLSPTSSLRLQLLPHFCSQTSTDLPLQRKRRTRRFLKTSHRNCTLLHFFKLFWQGTAYSCCSRHHYKYFKVSK